MTLCVYRGGFEAALNPSHAVMCNCKDHGYNPQIYLLLKTSIHKKKKKKTSSEYFTKLENAKEGKIWK